jgi:hypothetical protein
MPNKVSWIRFFLCFAAMVVAFMALPAQLALSVRILLSLLVGTCCLVMAFVAPRVGMRRMALLIASGVAGCLLARLFVAAFDDIVAVWARAPEHIWVSVARLLLLLSSLYLGSRVTWWVGQRWRLELPFIRLKPVLQRSREIVLDPSALADPRLLDLAVTGIFDRRLVLDEAVVAALRTGLDVLDEGSRLRARRCLETASKLQEIPHLGLRIEKAENRGIVELRGHLARLARELDADILMGEINQLEHTSYDGVRFISLHHLAAALKPLLCAGEFLDLKITRPGKDSSQGVGYLHDGTMVVVNGGGAFVGEDVKTRVLSVKPSTAGRIVFCNVLDERGELIGKKENPRYESAHRN